MDVIINKTSATKASVKWQTIRGSFNYKVTITDVADGHIVDGPTDISWGNVNYDIPQDNIKAGHEYKVEVMAEILNEKEDKEVSGCVTFRAGKNFLTKILLLLFLNYKYA